MINAIDLNNPDETSYFNEIGGNLRMLPNIKRINLFVGANNCGKSRFIRSFVKSDSINYYSDSNVDTNSFTRLRSNLLTSCVNLHSKETRFSVCDNHDDLSPCELYIFYKNKFDYLQLDKRDYTCSYLYLIRTVESTLDELYHSIVLLNNHASTNKKKFSRYYIPVLRGIECFKEFNNENESKELNSIYMNQEQRIAFDNYKQNIDKIYATKTSAAYEIDKGSIFTGENLFNEIRDKLLGSESERVFISEFEEFISRHFFDNEGFSIIPLYKMGYLNVKIGNSSERPLHNLGDGIKQLIVILYKAFELRNSESFLCIEEPEINLHPGYQRKLMELLQSEEFSKLYFFISTHSNHIVDSCFDYNNISVFKFINLGKANNRFQVINTSSKDIDILDQLGVNNSSVFMSNCTIWVEGISDKIYINKYLKTYTAKNNLREYKEGVDYSFVEYGGNNIVHWSFDDNGEDEQILASSITNRAFIIVDNDNDSKRKVKRKRNLERVFGKNYFELSVREIENTIGDNLLKKMLFDGAVKFKPGMDRKKDSIETKTAYVWKYIDDHFQLDKPYWNSSSKQPRVNKLMFAKLFCQKIDDNDELSESATELVKSVYSFIDRVFNGINN